MKPVCETVKPWLRANLGKGCLAGLTSADARALAAAVQIVELYSYTGCPTLAEAFGVVVRQMQPSQYQLAYHAIAHVKDWSDRARLWELAGLPMIAPWRCAHEPREGRAA